jgi:hypothetical protein
MMKFQVRFLLKKEIAENQAFLDEKENSGKKSWNAHFLFSTRSFASPKGSPQNRHGRSSSRSSQ